MPLTKMAATISTISRHTPPSGISLTYEKCFDPIPSTLIEWFFCGFTLGFLVCSAGSSIGFKAGCDFSTHGRGTGLCVKGMAVAIGKEIVVGC